MPVMQVDKVRVIDLNHSGVAPSVGLNGDLKILNMRGSKVRTLVHYQKLSKENVFAIERVGIAEDETSILAMSV